MDESRMTSHQRLPAAIRKEPVGTLHDALVLPGANVRTFSDTARA